MPGLAASRPSSFAVVCLRIPAASTAAGGAAAGHGDGSAGAGGAAASSLERATAFKNCSSSVRVTNSPASFWMARFTESSWCSFRLWRSARLRCCVSVPGRARLAGGLWARAPDARPPAADPAAALALPPRERPGEGRGRVPRGSGAVGDADAWPPAATPAVALAPPPRERPGVPCGSGAVGAAGAVARWGGRRGAGAGVGGAMGVGIGNGSGVGAGVVARAAASPASLTAGPLARASALAVWHAKQQ